MREILFRAKRMDDTEHNGKWVYGQYFKTPLTDENSGTTPDAGWFFLSGETRHCIVQDGVSFVIDEYTLGQYTGLKDRNGINIYEGDIVSWQEVTLSFKTYMTNEEVRFQDGLFEVNDHELLRTVHRISSVVGNVYDAPELIASDAVSE